MSGPASRSIATYPEPLAGQLKDGSLIAVLAVAMVEFQSSPMFLVSDVQTGEVTYVDAADVRLFPVLPGTDEDALGE